MKGPQYQYTKELYERFGYLATWTPASSIRLGDVGEMDGNIFRRISNLEQMNISFNVRRGESKENLIYTSASGVQLNFKVAGSPIDPGSTLLVQKAGVTIGFNKGAGVVFIARNCQSESIEDQILLGRELIRRYNIGEWEADYYVVTEVKIAASMSAFVSESTGGKIELIAENKMELGTLSLADLDAEFSVGVLNGINTQVIAKEQLTPLFRVRKVKASFWGGTKFSIEESVPVDLEMVPPDVEIPEDNVHLSDFVPNFVDEQ